MKKDSIKTFKITTETSAFKAYAKEKALELLGNGNALEDQWMTLNYEGLAVELGVCIVDEGFPIKIRRDMFSVVAYPILFEDRLVSYDNLSEDYEIHHEDYTKIDFNFGITILAFGEDKEEGTMTLEGLDEICDEEGFEALVDEYFEEDHLNLYIDLQLDDTFITIYNHTTYKEKERIILKELKENGFDNLSTMYVNDIYDTNFDNYGVLNK